ncbi:hypothetical protein BDY21DRAFT_364072 [Lineolata rhizophorae]|uniref:Uncharacterized protein n=1 Tax=Lineolata rhizophorae TaxID=578093 RepID=A0A6A6P003_9PEZI|nr:hypothetical protein BDY21DRAFT_364072 [Lineolata rhizophorae]
MTSFRSSTSSNTSLVERQSSEVYLRSGIGGAGNYRRKSSITLAAPAVPIIGPQSRAGSFSSGIGGAGNFHKADERAVLSFDEELARSRAIGRNAPTAYHVGIGGAGNRKHRGVSPSITVTASADNIGQQQTYSSEPLPFGAVDSFFRRLSGASRSTSRDASPAPSDTKRNGSIRSSLRV